MKNHIYQLEEKLVLLEERVMAFGLVQVGPDRSHEYNELTRALLRAQNELRNLTIQDASTDKLRRRADGVLAELVCMKPQLTTSVAA